LIQAAWPDAFVADDSMPQGSAWQLKATKKNKSSVDSPKLRAALKSISQLGKKHNASQFWVFGVHAGR
jgi:hypothetical protein